MLSDWDILAGQEPWVAFAPGVPSLVDEPTGGSVCDRAGIPALKLYQLVDAEAFICF